VRYVLTIALACVVLGAAPARAQETNDGAWLRTGDALASSDRREDLEHALDAYAHVAPSDAEHLRALTGRAWVLFLLDRTAESIAAYVALVDQLVQGPARVDALVMLGAMLADPDWDRDGAPDRTSTLERLADPAIVPQDRPWLAELYFETAHALYVGSHDPAAISVSDVALSRWPPPERGTPMDAACHRHRARPSTLHGEDARVRLATDGVCARHAL
jgi:hypothetical protein